MLETHPIPASLSDMDPTALTARLYELRRQERGLLVEFLTYLAEVDRRRVHVAGGYPSLFAFLTGYLGYSHGSAARRAQACRLLARFPAIAAYLADGRLNLTTLFELREVLDEDTHRLTLDRAAGKSEEQVKELVAALRPREAPPDLFRRLPSPAAPVPETAAALPAANPPAAPPPRRPARIEPISEELRVLRVTVGRDFVADLDAVRAALSHQIPDGDLVRVLHESLRRTRRELERRQAGATERPRPARAAAPSNPRTVTAALRREIHRRDGGRCTFVGTDGHICGSTHRLQLHHIRAFALGGPTTLDNLTLRCAVHNAFHAEQDFGSDHINRAISRAREERPAPG